MSEDIKLTESWDIEIHDTFRVSSVIADDGSLITRLGALQDGNGNAFLTRDDWRKLWLIIEAKFGDVE